MSCIRLNYQKKLSEIEFPKKAISPYTLLGSYKEETREENYGETREDIESKRIAKNRIAYLQSETRTD